VHYGPRRAERPQHASTGYWSSRPITPPQPKANLSPKAAHRNITRDIGVHTAVNYLRPVVNWLQRCPPFGAALWLGFWNWHTAIKQAEHVVG
jgi:hypothetical protein